MCPATPSQVFGLYYWDVIYTEMMRMRRERGRKRNEEKEKQFRGYKVLQVFLGMSAAHLVCASATAWSGDISLVIIPIILKNSQL